jgi:hypothetical protein
MVYMTQPGYPLDDSWIHQVIARNLMTGHGFGVVPDKPLSTATAPLWTLVLSLPWLLLGPIWSGVLTGMIFGFLSLLAIYNLSKIIFQDKNSPLFITLLTILCWPFIWGALSGMEVPLFTALSLWGVYSYLKSNSLKDRYNYLSYILFSLAFLSRPECGLFLAAVFIRDLFIWWKSGRKNNVSWIVKSLIIITVLGPYFLFNFSTSGNLFPRTLTAKVQNKGLLSVLYHGEIKRILKALTLFPYVYFQDFFRNIITLNPIISLAIIPGIIKFFNHPKIEKTQRLMLIFLIILYTPVIGAISPLMGAIFQNYRFVTNLLPLIILFGYMGLFFPVEVNTGRFRKPLLVTGILLISAGLATGLLFRFVDNVLIGLLIQNPSAMDAKAFSDLYNFVWKIGLGTIIIGGIFLSAVFIMSPYFQNLLNIPLARKALLILIFISAGIITLLGSGTYANNVRNINECDVDAAMYLSKIASPGDVLAVNDIGALGYYSKMEIFDLKGLASPEITVEMMNNDSLTFEYLLKNKRVDYFVIDPGWFDYIPGRTDVLRPLKVFHTEKNTMLSGETIVAYKAYWPEVNENK